VATYATVGYLDLYDGVDLYTWGRQNSLHPVNAYPPDSSLFAATHLDIISS
jgi:hypothetical protein